MGPEWFWRLLFFLAIAGAVAVAMTIVKFFIWIFSHINWV